MRRLLLAIAARRDFADIARFVTQGSGNVRAGRDFVQRLRLRCMDLSRLPGTLGVARPDLGLDLRVAYHGNYVIVFRYGAGVLLVLRVIEGHRDVERQFPPGED